MDEGGWTEVVAEDLQALARLAALAPITPQELVWAGYPSAEDEWQEDDWFDDETLPLFRNQGETDLCGMPVLEGAVERYLAWSWPALKAAVVGFLRTWPGNAPLIQ